MENMEKMEKKFKIEPSIFFLSLTVINLILMGVSMFILPDMVPVHFSTDFIVDTMGSKFWLLLFSFLPFLLALVYWFVTKKNIVLDIKTINIIFGISICFLLYANWLFYFLNISNAWIGERITIYPAFLVGLPISLLCFILGYYLPQVKPNNTFGLKIKETLNNEVVWEKTHNLFGVLLIISAILIAFVAYFASKLASVLLFIGGVLGLLIISFGASILYAKYLYKKNSDTKIEEKIISEKENINE